jgi:hypothetical protein
MPDSSKKVFDALNLDMKFLSDADNIKEKEISFKKPDNLFNRI